MIRVRGSFYSCLTRFGTDKCALDIDAPLSAPAQPQNQASPEQIAMIVDMGFTPAQAKKALRESVSD